MRSLGPAALMVAASAIALWPALAQRSPESILPPGFSQPEPAAPAAPTAPKAGEPASALPAPAQTSGNVAAAPTDTLDALADGVVEDSSNNMTAAVAPVIDLPAQARRSLDRVGVMKVEDGGLGEQAFGSTDGRYLSTLMQRIKAPVASRWASILLRRALLSQSASPASVDGADWVAERAWLLLRMGEADMASALVARVDSDNFTSRLDAIALQAALATGDPASLCGIVGPAAGRSNEPSWPLSQAMCSGLAGESGTASALVDQVRDSGAAQGIDVLLAEKVVGAATNTRRSVSIQWDGVDQLTAWRFGLASATGVAIPPKLFDTNGPQFVAWQARSPLISPDQRLTAAETAATLGVFSSAAFVDFVGGVWDEADSPDRSGSLGEQLRAAYSADGESARLSALRSIWGDTGAYGREILTARAAAEFPASKDLSSTDADRLIASMMSAGLDIQAARWANSVSSGSLGWAMLAVGAPRPIAGIDASAVKSISGGEDDRRIKFLLAGLAGLGRLAPDQASSLAQSYDVPLARADSWTRAIDRAATAGEAGTVALLAAAGMQTREWRYVPPAYLYHIVSALRRVGLEPEARMIAAEALARA
ncbi:MAG: hypothetical protein V4530_12040 [Pseudomonadota bacterium]